MKRVAVFLYGVLSYAIFFATFLYFIGFLANMVVPKSIDSGTSIGGVAAFLLNFSLIALFGLQHSIMARPSFKSWWTKIVPEQMERSTYVLLSSLIVILLFWLWQPSTTEIWSLGGSFFGALLSGLFLFGWVLLLYATFLVNHFDLFGLRQVYLYLIGKDYTPVPFKLTGLYKYSRHPIMLGWLIVFWVTPVMTTGHLLFALLNTLYIFIGIHYEERNLAEAFGEQYTQFKVQTPMLIPFLKRAK